MNSRFLGVLMLDTAFPRLPGDVGHPGTFEALGIPARHHVVPGASPRRVVRDADPALLPPFLQAAGELVRQGAAMITTSCGFLAMFQRELQQAVPVPVLSSSLLWLPRLQAAGERAGVLTIDAQALDARHFRGVGAATDTPVAGVPEGCEFQRRILGNEAVMDTAQAERDVVDGALALVRRHPQIGCIVLECTNMPPYAEAVREATGRRVEHLTSLVRELWEAR
jgi:hypothetical protein